MAQPLTEEEKQKIEEEEKMRVRIALQYEQKSSGIAGVLSSICPGLGQIYNGQMGKASLYLGIVVISLLVLTMGIIFQMKGMPEKKESPITVESSEPVEMSEEGVVIESETEQEESTSEVKNEKKPVMPVILIILGAIGILAGWNYSVKDAINSAKRLNSSH
jgi:H+/gluconate symporter-like permease